MRAVAAFRYLDLLRVQYARKGYDVATGLSCFGALLEVHRRLGYPDPHLPWCSGSDALESAAVAWAQDPKAWRHLGNRAPAAREIGDVLATRSEFAPLGCAVLVSKSPKLYLTSLPGRGVVLLKERHLEASVIRAVRRTEAPR
jgi:hypothetical protein